MGDGDIAVTKRVTTPFRAPMSVIGHHGCLAEVADGIISNGFMPSRMYWDWLGDGAYFWEYAPQRAADWAMERFPDKEIAVLEATISLGNCLNLLDTDSHVGLVESYNDAVRDAERSGVSLPLNTSRVHSLDKIVVELFCERWVRTGGHSFQTVRGCFPEGKPIFLESKILTLTHVQLAVRDPSVLPH